jgi:hypothetical protein
MKLCNFGSKRVSAMVIQMNVEMTLNCHMISLQGPLSLYCKTVPADFNSETRNPVALPKPWSGSMGQVYV